MINFNKISEYSTIMEHDKWFKEIPFIQFPGEWLVQITPPFNGAVVRFRVKYNNKEVSVYLDCYDNLGFMGYPYWEIYPNKYGDNERFEMNDIEGLMKGIERSLESKGETNER